MVTLTTCKYNTWHFFWRVPVMHAGHLWVTPSKSWCIRTNTCPKNKLTRRKFRKKNNKYYNLYLHVGFFFFTKNLRRWCFVVNRFIFLPLWFILILIPFTFPFFSVTHNLRKKESTCTQKEVGDFSISDMNNICVNKVTLITLLILKSIK